MNPKYHNPVFSTAVVRRALLAAFVGTLLVLAGCEDGPTKTDPMSLQIALCGSNMTRGQFGEMLDGNMHVVAEFSEDGKATAQIVGGFIAGFVINTLDFDALHRWDFTHSNGRYRIRNGRNTMDLYLILDEPFEGYQAGDTLRENLFLPSSFVRSVSANLSGVSYTKGPLFNLISGNISWSGTTPRFRVDAARFTLGVVSNGNWIVRWRSGAVDTVLIRMASVPLDLGALKADFENGKMGFSYDSTRHSSLSKSLEQQIYQSGFNMSPLDEQGTRWSWEGEYRNRVDKTFLMHGGPSTVFIRGHVSTVNGNYSAYYCDEALTDSLGVSVEDTSLTWGYFKSVNGDSIPYGLVPTEK
jgi:hypothetical protein